MKAEKLFTIITVLFALGVTESFGAASIRSTSVGASAPATTASRAGSLRSESAKAPTTKVSTSVSTAPVATDSGRMASLPGGMPKVSKPNLPSAAYTATIDLSDIEARLADLQTNKADLDALNGLATLDDLDTKANADEIYTKDQVDELIPDVSRFATKTELNTKANVSSVYTKDEVDEMIPEAGTSETRVGEIIDNRLNSYSTTTQMNSAINSATSGLATTTQMNSAISSATSGLATTASVNSALGRYVQKPTSGNAGQVLALTDSGDVEWIDAVSGANIQIKTFDDILYYCGKTGGETCSESNVSDGWVATNMSASDGKTAWLKIENDIVYVCYKENECGAGDTWTQLTSLAAYAKSSDLTSLSNQINDTTTGLGAAYSLASGANTAASAANTAASQAQETATAANTAASQAQQTASAASTAANAAQQAATAAQQAVANAYTSDTLTQSVIEGLGFETSTTAGGKYALANSLSNYIAIPTGGSAGQVLSYNGSGFEWVNPGAASNAQFHSFDGVLYYCGKTNGVTCATDNQSDGWVSTGFTGGGSEACQNYTFSLSDESDENNLVYDIVCAD